jgi:hypothetical protein
MTNMAFDTLRFSQRLAEAGFTATQAAGIAAATADALAEPAAQLATRHDLSMLRQELKAEIAALRQELKAEIAALRQEAKSDLAQLELRMTVKLGTMMAGAVALAAALAKLL